MDNRATAVMLLTISAAAMAPDIPFIPDLVERDRAPWARKGSRGPGRRRWGGDTKASRRNSPRFTANGRKLKRKKNRR
tara:strand:+ start:172937 stop:173170 length:234 start_codon:yes stop_codon:yes gene_type:complete